MKRTAEFVVYQKYREGFGGQETAKVRTAIVKVIRELARNLLARCSKASETYELLDQARFLRRTGSCKLR